jgi:thiol-disulfide isomerase/thioredoxin
MRFKTFTKLLIVAVAAVFCTNSVFAQITIDQDFDALNAGEQVVAQGADQWTTWSNNPGSSEDPYVSDAQANSGSNSMLIETGNDAVLLLDDQTSGRYSLSFQIYVPEGKLGYYNILHAFDGGDSEWGLQTYFDAGGEGRVDGGGSGAGSFTYNYDEWVFVNHIVDLDNDWCEMFVNNQLVVSYQWSMGTFNEPGLNQLGAFNFFAWDGSSDGTPQYYIDDVDVHEVTIPADGPMNLDVALSGMDATLTWDAPASGDVLNYVVYKNGAIIAHTDTETFEETLPLPGTYEYMVQAILINGLSPESNTVEAVIDGGSERELVLVEIGTGTWCGYCPGAAMGADELVEHGHDVAVIEYHSGDIYEISEGAARLEYYDVAAFPTAVFDGNYDFVEGGNATNSLYPTYAPIVDGRDAVTAAFEVDFEAVPADNDNFVAKVTLNKTWDYADDADLRLHIVLTESHIAENWGGLSEVNFVARGMFPNENGTAVDFSSGDEQVVEVDVEILSDFNQDNCELVVFLQDKNTKEVLNVTATDLSFIGVEETVATSINAYPNPATDMITFEASSDIKKIQMFNQAGQIVRTIAADQNEISVSVSDLSSGLYIVKFETVNGDVFKKVSIR